MRGDGRGVLKRVLVALAISLVFLSLVHARKRVRLVLVPFDTDRPLEMAFIRDGIMDMLSSRMGEGDIDLLEEGRLSREIMERIPSRFILPIMNRGSVLTSLLQKMLMLIVPNRKMTQMQRMEHVEKEIQIQMATSRSTSTSYGGQMMETMCSKVMKQLFNRPA